jgi:hypothetical protein
MPNSTQKEAKTPEVISDAMRQGEQQQVKCAITLLEKRGDLEESARYSKALRRHRIIQRAENLLRMVMLYSLSDLSLRMVGLWGTVMGWGSLSKSGVRKRLRQCQAWIGMLIVQVLVAGQVRLPEKGGYHLEAIDVSNVSQPGSHKIDWRLHMRFDLTQMRITGVQLTDSKQGETLTRWQFSPQTIILADRIYGVANSLGVLFGAGAAFVIRIGWQNLPLTDREGQRFAITDWLGVLSNDPASPPAQVQLWVNTPQGRFPLRLVARAIPPDKAEKIRRNLRAEAKHKKRNQDERSLLAAGFVMVVSNLPDTTWTTSEILALYRLRWQIELVFKRLKSLLHFDHLRATDPQLAQVYLLTKILIALLIGEAQWRFALAAADAAVDPQRPLSHWRLTQLLLEAFRYSVCGALTWEMIASHIPKLDRYLFDEPRRRLRQLSALPDLDLVCGF